ncbi:MAG: SDR family oxidoreductase [Planctomycetaceae bacterium]
MFRSMVIAAMADSGKCDLPRFPRTCAKVVVCAKFPQMSFASLHEKRIVVTGSSSGIGRAIAVECAAAGSDIVISCRASRPKAEIVADEIRRAGRKADVLVADIADDNSRSEFVSRCFETGRVDAVVNNAGADLLTGALRDAPFSVKLKTLLDVDVCGTVELSRAFGQRFLKQGHGSILTIGWDQSDRGMEGDSGELFSTAKIAIMGFTRSLSLSLAPTVRVNCIAPGWIKTDWGESASDYWQQRVLNETPLKRWGLPQDVAAMARFLLSDEASYITGQVLNVNGGAVR